MQDGRRRVEIGYWLSSEEHEPLALVRNARRAEELGFSYAMISDHFHPWIDKQGQSAFVWSVIGGIAAATERIRLGTGVTCPTIRTHPAIIAHAAATAAAMMPGRFMLGLGSGENLNEHVVGRGWPAPDVRHEMLGEAIELIRLLWQGGMQTHRGRYFTVEDARVYTLPETLPPILIAASGPKAAELAGAIGDGLIATDPDARVVRTFEEAGGRAKPKYGHFQVYWARSEKDARKRALELWPTAGLTGPVGSELRLPEHYEALAKLVTEERIAEAIPCGPDPQPYFEMIRSFVDAGFDHVALHQVGPDQEGFFGFYERQLAPELERVLGSAPARAR